MRKIPGLKKFTNITLKRGITGDVDFWNWIVRALNGQVQRADGAIVLLDENRKEVMRWNFDRGWPCKYTGPTLEREEQRDRDGDPRDLPRVEPDRHLTRSARRSVTAELPGLTVEVVRAASGAAAAAAHRRRGLPRRAPGAARSGRRCGWRA